MLGVFLLLYKWAHRWDTGKVRYGNVCIGVRSRKGAVWGDGVSDLVDVVEVTSLLRPVAVTHRGAILRQTGQVHNDDTALLPHHLKCKQYKVKLLVLAMTAFQQFIVNINTCYENRKLPICRAYYRGVKQQ